MKDKGTVKAMVSEDGTSRTSSLAPDQNPVGTPGEGDGVARPLSMDGIKQPTVDMQAFIGRQLRAVYDDIARQPVPDRFLELMKQLEGKTVGG